MDYPLADGKLKDVVMTHHIYFRAHQTIRQRLIHEAAPDDS